jgi:hypothetical protein
MAGKFFLTYFHPVEYVYCYFCILFMKTFYCSLEAEHDLSNSEDFIKVTYVGFCETILVYLGNQSFLAKP